MGCLVRVSVVVVHLRLVWRFGLWLIWIRGLMLVGFYGMVWCRLVFCGCLLVSCGLLDFGLRVACGGGVFLEVVGWRRVCYVVLWFIVNSVDCNGSLLLCLMVGLLLLLLVYLRLD